MIDSEDYERLSMVCDEADEMRKKLESQLRLAVDGRDFVLDKLVEANDRIAELEIMVDQHACAKSEAASLRALLQEAMLCVPSGLSARILDELSGEKS